MEKQKPPACICHRSPSTCEPLPPICPTVREQLLSLVSEAPSRSQLCAGIRWCPMLRTKLDNWPPSAAPTWLIWPVGQRQLPVHTHVHTWVHWQAQSCSHTSIQTEMQTKCPTLLRACFSRTELKQCVSECEPCVICLFVYMLRFLWVPFTSWTYTPCNLFCFVIQPRC